MIRAIETSSGSLDLSAGYACSHGEAWYHDTVGPETSDTQSEWESTDNHRPVQPLPVQPHAHHLTRLAGRDGDYDETVGYPGFYQGAYYGKGGGLMMSADRESSDAMELEALAAPKEPVAQPFSAAPKDSVVAPVGSNVSPSPLQTGSPMWGRQGGLGFFSPQRNGPTIVIDVDRTGSIQAITDALGNRAAYGYDLAGNVTSVTDPNGDVTRFGYDSAGRLTAVVDALFNETDFSYDENGLVSEETIVLDGRTLARTYDHDAAGRLVRKVDRNGRVTVYGYDQSGRMTHEIWYATAADGDVNRLNTITWTYDEAGNLTSVADNSSCYVYSYDARGRLLSQSVMPIGGPVTVLTIGYGAREDALPISLSATVDGVADFLTSFEYDSQGRVVAIRQTGQGGNEVADKHVTFAYADTGALERIVRYESLDASQMVAVSEYRYDQFGRLVALDHFQNVDDPLAQYTWTYEGGGLIAVNSAGNQDNPLAGFAFSLDSLLASTTEARVNPLPDHVWTFDAAFTGVMTRMTSPDGVAEYSYDARGQLTGASYDYQPGELYPYDANGNRTNPGYVTGAYNRLLSDGTYNYEYDAEGNRIKRTDIATGAVTEYVWDHRNRLVAVIDRTSDGGPILQSVEYAYDSQNRWIAKSIDIDGDAPKDATSTYFVYDGNQIILQIDAEGQVTNRYLWGPAVDQILADEQVQFDGSSATLWTLTDHLSTVRDLAVQGAETGVTTIANHLVYDAFGRVTSQTDPTVVTLFGFTARPFDRDTGLQNNLNRWYDAETGTWISEDPKGFAAADANLYRYVGNQVTVATDPHGLYWNWGNPLSKPMWDMWYYSGIEKEAKERIRQRCLRDPNYAADNIRKTQKLGEHEANATAFIARSGVEANAMILGGGFVRSSAGGAAHKAPARSVSITPRRSAHAGVPMSVADAIDEVRRGGNVIAEGRDAARRIAEAAGGGPAIWDPPHGPGQKPHFHPTIGGERAPGHVLY